jgi:hypothetical protein
MVLNSRGRLVTAAVAVVAVCAAIPTVAQAQTGSGGVSPDTAKIATQLTAARAVLGLTKARQQTVTMTATLRAGRVDLARQGLTFRADDTVLCTVATSAEGTATCPVTASAEVQAVVRVDGYSVTYAGDTKYAASSASAGLTGIAGPPKVVCSPVVACKIPPAVTPPPPLPQVPGCYTYSTAKKRWLTEDCLPKSVVLKQGPPPSASGQAPPGLETTTASTPPTSHGKKILLDGSDVLDLGSYTGSSTVVDNHYGQGGFSVQNNTNYFHGTNGDTDWVQFVFQNFVSSNRACIWQIDVTVANATHNNSGYDPTGCYTMTAGPEIVWGASDRTPGLLEMYTVTETGVNQGTVQKDLNGMGEQWTAASGGILGAGGGSELLFPKGWSEYNALTITDCSYFIVSTADCPSRPVLPSGSKEFASGVTGESSNLYSSATPARHTEDSGHDVFIDYTMTPK